MSRQEWATAAGTPLPPPQSHSVTATLSMHTTRLTAHGVRRGREALQPKKLEDN